MPNEPIQGLPYPAATVIPDVPTDIKALADAIAGRLVMRFASKAERDSVLTAPVDGMVCVTLDYGILWRYSAAVGVTRWIVVNVPTFASIAIRDAQISAPVVGTKAVVGSGTSMTEYLFDGSSWRPAPITPRGASCTLVSGTYVGGTAVGLENPVGNMIVSNNWLICPEDGYYMVTWTHRITSQTGSIFPGLYRLRSGVSANAGVLGDLLVTSGEVVTMPPAVVSLLAGDGLRPYLGEAGGVVTGSGARGYFTVTRVA